MAKSKEGRKRSSSSEAMKKVWLRPEFYELQRNNTQNRWDNDPEFRKKQSDGMKRKWKDPEFREKMLATLTIHRKKRWE